MRINQILVTWIGHTDVKAMASSLPDSKKEKVIEITGKIENADIGLGPVKTLTSQVNFNVIYLR